MYSISLHLYFLNFKKELLVDKIMSTDIDMSYVFKGDFLEFKNESRITLTLYVLNQLIA